jgi:hypothetical protein
VHISRVGVIPKPQPGKWRLIADLSSPVNDRELCSVCYASVDDAVRCIRSLGRGVLLDIAHVVPVHPVNRFVLGGRWWEDILVDGALPFSCRSAPKRFTAVADALLWVTAKHVWFTGCIIWTISSC